MCFEGYNTCPYPTGSACLTDSDGQKKCSPFTCVNPALSSTTNDSANLTSLQADGTVDEQGNCSGKILIFNGSPGECRPAGLKTNYKSCCDPDLSQSNLLNSCSQNERMTAVRDRDGLCHYVGEYCKNKITGVGCVQKARVYCCFNSKLARIIQEQGRIQLGIGWGDAKSPDCRGFGPDEFSMLD
ncbi:MAG: conjugal transfer protein TraN, partial [Proteobacteria bacterium]|nr:conjugal transfer protein TraN [Pseudomonadota bacterium]